MVTEKIFRNALQICKYFISVQNDESDSEGVQGGVK